MYQIQISIDETIDPLIDIEQLETAIRAALTFEQAKPGEIGVLVTGDEKMAALNNAFRGIASPTDVLSFPSGPSPAIPDLPYYYGDIAISIDRALEQAPKNEQSVEEELLLLVVHGTLHLLGYDHSTEEDEKRMWAKQSEILAGLKE
ncbi:MAG: rRNA maturation RNase YbeY [Anaerolineales bacterium]|nr:rRNA maturation RNase YbeY [Anaerolineales bacterium]